MADHTTRNASVVIFVADTPAAAPWRFHVHDGVWVRPRSPRSRPTSDLKLFVQHEDFHGLPLDAVRLHGFCRRRGIQDVHERLQVIRLKPDGDLIPFDCREADRPCYGLTSEEVTVGPETSSHFTGSSTWAVTTTFGISCLLRFLDCRCRDVLTPHENVQCVSDGRNLPRHRLVRVASLDILGHHKRGGGRRRPASARE